MRIVRKSDVKPHVRVGDDMPQSKPKRFPVCFAQKTIFALIGLLTFSCFAYEVESDPNEEMEVTRSGTYSGFVKTWQNSRSQRTRETHIYRIRVPEGKRAVATLQYTDVDFSNDDYSTRGWALTLNATRVPNGKGRGIYDETLYSDANAIVEGWSYGGSCAQTVYYELTVRYIDLKPDLTISASSSQFISIDEPLKLKFHVKNSGNKSAEASIAKVYNGKGSLLKTISVGALSVGKTESHEVTLSGLTVGSNQTFRVVADANNDVEESNESNNQTTISLNVYQKVSRVIRFHSNGGSGTMPNQTIVCGTSTALSSNKYTREDYVFSGWATTPNGGVTYKDGADILTYYDNVDLYAVWSVKTCNVTFKSEDEEIDVRSYPTISPCGTSLPVATKKNCDFIGWFTEPNGGVQISSNTIFKVDSTVYARFSDPTVTLTYHSGTGETAEYKIPVGESKLPSNPFVREGYKFVGWHTNKERVEGEWFFQISELSSDSGGNNRVMGLIPEYKEGVVYQFDSDKNLYAIWSTIYTLRFSAGGGNGYMSDRIIAASDYIEPACEFTNEGLSFAAWEVSLSGGVLYHTATWGKELVLQNRFTGGVKYVTAQDCSWVVVHYNGVDNLRSAILSPDERSRIFIHFPRVKGYCPFRIRRGGDVIHSDIKFSTDKFPEIYFDIGHFVYKVTNYNEVYPKTYSTVENVFPTGSGDPINSTDYKTESRYGFIRTVTYCQNDARNGNSSWNADSEAGTSGQSFSLIYPTVFVPTEHNLSAARTVTNIVLSTQTSWTATVSSDWISVEKDPSNPYKGIVTVLPNNSIEPRTGIISTTNEYAIVINQASSVPSVNVFFDANGGTVVTNRKWYAARVKLGSLPTPSRDCYSFAGWYTQREGGVLIDASSVLNENTALYARWKKSIYTVQFDGNGGSVDAASRQIEFGSAIGVLPKAQKSGYDFIGWSTKQNGTEIISTESLVSSDVTLYAIFRQKPILTYSVTFNANGGSVFPESLSVSNGSAIGTLPTPVRSGYTFNGWYTVASGGTMISASTVVTGNATYYAQWVETEYVNYGLYPDSDVSITMPTEMATVYDGYLYNNGGVIGTIQVKVSKQSRTEPLSKATATIQIIGEKKRTIKGEVVRLGTEKGLGYMFEHTFKDGSYMRLEFWGLYGMYGYFDDYMIDGARNRFSSKDKGEKADAEEILKPYLGAYSMICDGGILSVNIAKKGKVTIKGTIEGNKVSAKAQVLIGEDVLCIPVIYSKKSVNLAFTIWLPIDGGNAEIIGLDDAVIGKAGTLKNGARFIVEGDIGDYIETEDERTLELLPNGEIVTVSGSKWLVADGIKPAKVAYKKGEFTITEGKKGAGIANPSGLKLTYKSKDGSFKGSFTAYGIVKGKLKKHKASVEGVLVNGVGYGTITIKRIGTWAVTIK